ncbi:MAG: hypothetical protein KBD21_05600 [Candidatus Pacebacteria bacterium]|nr:hypothetical protein [Candidatus Paceibacterota bacterium]
MWVHGSLCRSLEDYVRQLLEEYDLAHYYASQDSELLALAYLEGCMNDVDAFRRWGWQDLSVLADCSTDTAYEGRCIGGDDMDASFGREEAFRILKVKREMEQAYNRRGALIERAIFHGADPQRLEEDEYWAEVSNFL